jgi:TRAP-type C4-dicarboxylate transport system permease small subunit
LKTFCDRLEAGLRQLLVVVVAVMVLTVTWQVLSRLLARLAVWLDLPLLVEPSRWTEELAGFELAWLALLGAVYALRRREHPGFDLVYSKMSAATRRYADLAGFGLIMAFSLIVLTYGGGLLVRLTLELGQTTAALGWPMGVVYSVIPISGVLMTVFALEGFLESLRSGPDEQPAAGEPA